MASRPNMVATDEQNMNALPSADSFIHTRDNFRSVRRDFRDFLNAFEDAYNQLLEDKQQLLAENRKLTDSESLSHPCKYCDIIRRADSGATIGDESRFPFAVATVHRDQDGKSELLIHFNTRRHEGYFDSVFPIPIRYCPMCGRPLRED